MSKTIRLKENGFSLVVLIVVIVAGFVIAAGAYTISRQEEAEQSTAIEPKEEDVESSPSIKCGDEVKCTSPAEIARYEAKSGVPFGEKLRLRENADMFWVEERVVDGDYRCVLYHPTSYIIHGEKTINSGQDGSPQIPTTVYYDTEGLDEETVKNLLDTQCYVPI